MSDSKTALARVLELPTNPLSISAVPVGSSGAFIGLDQKGRPGIVLPSSHVGPVLRISFGTVSLRLGESLTVITRGQPAIVNRFDLVRCDSPEVSIRESFMVVTDAIVASFEKGLLSSSQLADLLAGVQQVFKERPSSDFARRRQGLWGELHFATHTNSPAKWLECWHSDPFRRWDFTTGNMHVEVKTAAAGTRAHSFAHRQLLPTSTEQVLVVSMLLDADPNGLSLRSLIVEARVRIGDRLDVLMKLETSVRAAGMVGSQDPGPSFDDGKAVDSVRYFWAPDVPRFPLPEPIGVTDTHYRVDLSKAVDVDRGLADSWLHSWLGD